MKSIPALLIIFLPLITMAQESSSPDDKNGTFIFDFKKKKPKQVDTVLQRQPVERVAAAPKPKKEKMQADTGSIKVKHPDYYDFKKEGVFNGLFHAGINACQVDGDTQYGYFYFGGEVGVGALAHFHKYLSASLELNYTMKGAGSWLLNHLQTAETYLLRWDYVEMPVTLNAHYRRLLIFSAGLAPGYMVFYKEKNNGINVTDNPHLGQPRKFDLPVFAGVSVIIKKHYVIGWKISYSTLKIRSSYPATRVNGEFNNYMTLRFIYILTKKST